MVEDAPRITGPFAYDAARERLGCFEWIGKKSELQFWDLKAGKKIFGSRDVPKKCTIAWTPDGRLIQSGAAESGNFDVAIRDAAGVVLQRWSAPALGQKRSGLPACAPLDDRRLAVVDGDGRSTIRDLATGAELVAGEEPATPDSRAQLAVSRDGKLLAVTAEDKCAIVDSATGKRLALIDGDDRSSRSGIHFSADSKTIYYVAPKADAFETTGGNPLLTFRPERFNVDTVVGVSHDGRRLLCQNSRDPVIYQIDVATGLEINPQPGHGSGTHIVWLPGNKSLLAHSLFENAWSCWNVETGQRERLFDRIDNRTTGWSHRGTAIALTPDGSELIDFNPNDLFGIPSLAFDTRTGWISRKFPLLDYTCGVAMNGESDRVLTMPLGYRDQPRDHWLFAWWNLKTHKSEKSFILENDFPTGDIEANARYIALYPPQWGADRPDENGIRPQYPHAVRIYSASTGEKVHILEHPGRTPLATRTWTKDFELLLTDSIVPREFHTGTEQPKGRRKGERHLWEIASGREIARWSGSVEQSPLGLEPGGRYAVQDTGASGFEIYEPYALRRVIAEVKVPAPVESFSFSPDGRRLATVLADTTIVVWDTAPWEAAIAKEMRSKVPADIGPLVAELVGEPKEAYAAGRLLAAAGDRAVTALKAKVGPAPKPDADRIRRWLADLDDPQFAVREKASKELAALGERAEPALKAALAAKPNAEVKSRLEKLVERIKIGHYDPATLRDLRAVRVLRDIDTPAAKQFLVELAKGDESAPQTKAAKQATIVLSERDTHSGR